MRQNYSWDFQSQICLSMFLETKLWVRHFLSLKLEVKIISTSHFSCSILFKSLIFFLEYSLKKVTKSPLTSNLRPRIIICYFQQTVQKFGSLDILSHFVPKRMWGGVMHLLPLLPKLPLSRVFFLKSIKNIFWPEKWGFLTSCFTTEWGNICGLKSIRKGQGKAMLPKVY